MYLYKIKSLRSHLYTRHSQQYGIYCFTHIALDPFPFPHNNGVSTRHGISIVDKPPAVLDIYGNSLLKGEHYYLRPIFQFRPRGGAIIIGVDNYGCLPLLLVDFILTEYAGVPVTFSPVETEEDEVIRESTDLYIEFSDSDRLSPTCKGSFLGVLADQTTLFIGGVKEDSSSSFKIEKGPGFNDYKIVSTLYNQDIGTRRSSDELGAQNLILAYKNLGFILGFAFSPPRD